MTTPDPATAARSTLPSDDHLHKLANRQPCTTSGYELRGMASEILRLRAERRLEIENERMRDMLGALEAVCKQHGKIAPETYVAFVERLAQERNHLRVERNVMGKERDGLRLERDDAEGRATTLACQLAEMRHERDAWRKEVDLAMKAPRPTPSLDPRKHPRIELGPDYRAFRLIDRAGHEVDLPVKSCRIDVEPERWATATLVLSGVEVDAKVREVVFKAPVDPEEPGS